MELFSQPTREWFVRSFVDPTRVQTLGWPRLAAGEHALLLAPTGSGKTLAAFLWALDRLSRREADAEARARPGVRMLYVSPLKALVYDIERNLRAPRIGIQRAAERLGVEARMPQVDVRTGDTPAIDRRRQLREPGEILVTTPESLFLLLASQARETLRTVETVIVDEIHALAPTKRGAHLALSLERLAELAERDPQRIGLSATVDPPDEAARFLGGDRPVEIVDASEPAHVELRIEVPVPDMENPPSVEAERGGSILAPEEGPREQGLWPSIYPRLLDLVLEHRSTIVFVNSRGLCERLSQRLNELWQERRRADAGADGSAEGESPGDGEELVRAHHGSVSHGQRTAIEEALKAGRLRGIVATSSLELGIDMGAVDLVVLVESPGSVARGLQRVGRAGHSVGERSRGILVPKYRGDLLECAVVAERMQAGALEPIRVPSNALDVLAQQLVAICVDRERGVDELRRLVRRAYPFRELADEALVAVLDMLSGRYPSEELADLRPRLNWDRGRDRLSARPGAETVLRFNAGTIPDRGLYGVYLAGGEDGRGGVRLGELDEEMVHESRKGDTFYLGASTWRIVDLDRDRVIVVPAPGAPARMPFWRGDGPGRPIELGRAVGAFLRRLGALDESAARRWLERESPLDEWARDNLLAYVAEQREHTGTLPTDRAITVERFRDELGDWRVCILTPFGSRVHAPWAMAIEQRLSSRAGFEVETMYTDDGIMLRLPDVEELPSIDLLLPEPEEIEELVLDQVGNSALFASVFRENAARSLLLPRRRPGRRTALWQQRLRAKNLLAAVRKYPNFPVVLESYRQCLSDVFDLPALEELLSAVRRRELRVDAVETPSPSPFARSLVFTWVGHYLYELDAPLAERRAQALSLDRALLRELLGEAELRELLDRAVIEEVEEELQGLAYGRRARNADDLHDLLRRVGDLGLEELRRRSGFAREGDEGVDGEERESAPGPPVETWLERLVDQRRAIEIRLAGERRFVAAEDAARYRDALGIQPPPGLPDSLLESAPAPLESLIARFARTHGPFRTAEVARRFDLLPAQVEPVLENLLRQDRLRRGEILPGGSGLEWCDPEVLRRIKRRTLARLRHEVAPVEGEVLGRFLPRWHGLLETSEAGDRPARVAGPAALDEALTRLEGMALPWSALVRDLLPARVPDFEASWLDMLAASGELVWIGRGALGTADGRVALYRRERVAELLVPEGDFEPPSELHRRLLERLEQRGASFTVELERAVEGTSARELEAALWDLVWAGQVTNDTFLPLHALGQPQRRRRGGARSAAPRWGRPRPGSGAGSPAGALLGGGRWSRVVDLLEPPGTEAQQRARETHRRHALVTTLLERYGVVSRETAVAEEIVGGFSVLYPLLREMEEAGRIRRGYFVDGLAGRQFALPGAVDRLRAERDRSSGVLALPAIDPANPWGALLPWPRGERDDGPRPRRVAGAWLVLEAGLPLLFLEASGRSLVTLRGFRERLEDGAAGALIAALVEVARRQRRRSLLLERIDGLPALEWSGAQHFVEAGFEREYRGLLWSAGSTAGRAAGRFA